jgi:transposase
MYSQFVGIDISSQDAQVAIQHSDGQLVRVRISQTAEGYAELGVALEAAGCQRSSSLLVMEATGVYWMCLATYLYERGWQVSVINPAQAHYFARALLQRSKTDRIDAHTLMLLAARLQPACWRPPSATHEAVLQRLNQRDACLCMIQQERNRLHALIRRPEPDPQVVARLQAHIDFLLAQVADIEAELKRLVAADPAWQSTAALLRSIPGFGPVVTCWLMAATHLFTACQSPEQIASYAGLAPRLFESGSSVRARPALGFAPHRRLRQALYMATLSAIQHNPIIRAFYRRLLDRGKPSKVALCACARKLIHIAWGVVIKQQAFDPAFALVYA